MVVWDNASLLHSATLIDPDDARTLWRITVKEPGSQKEFLNTSGTMSLCCSVLTCT